MSKKNANAVKTIKAVKNVESVVDVKNVEIKTHANAIAFSDKRPGVVATILECLSNATKDNAVTKNEILNVLVTRFADNAKYTSKEDAISKMKATLMMQCPSGLKIEKRVVVVTVQRESDQQRAYYVDHAATKKCQAEYAAKKLEAQQHATKIQKMYSEAKQA